MCCGSPWTQRSRYTDGRSGDMWCWGATAEAGSNLSLCIAVEGGCVWIKQYITRKVLLINMSTQRRKRLPLQGPSSQRRCGAYKRRAAAYVPGCMRSVGIFGRVTPGWSAGAGSSGAVGAARYGASEMHWLSLWICFVHLGAPDDRTQSTIYCMSISKVQYLNAYYAVHIKALNYVYPGSNKDAFL